jgi:hypothetical protein
MLKLLHHDDHLPGSGKDGFIALFLPEADIELPVGGLTTHHSGCELALSCLCTHDMAVAVFSLEAKPIVADSTSAF